MPQYWTPLGGLQLAPAGIGIVDDPMYPNFFAQTAAALVTLNSQPVGAALIAGLIAKRAQNKYLSIKPPRNGGDACEAQSLNGDAARTLVTQAIGSGGYQDVINALKLAMNSSGHQRDWAWLAGQLNAIPRYVLAGAVAGGAGNYGILPGDVQNWIEGARPLLNPYPDQDKKFLWNAIQLFLRTHNFQVAGAGGNSVVYWHPTKPSTTLSNGAMNVRPPYVSLGHELIHAYHNAHGTQLSWSEDSTHSSTVLFEYMCVGLGPFAGAPTPTENGIRAEHMLAARVLY